MRKPENLPERGASPKNEKIVYIDLNKSKTEISDGTSCSLSSCVWRSIPDLTWGHMVIFPPPVCPPCWWHAWPACWVAETCICGPSLTKEVIVKMSRNARQSSPTNWLPARTSNHYSFIDNNNKSDRIVCFLFVCIICFISSYSYVSLFQLLSCFWIFFQAPWWRPCKYIARCDCMCLTIYCSLPGSVTWTWRGATEI